MQARVDQLVPYGYTDATIGTFHAFGDRLIREYALELGLPTDVRVLSRAEVVIFLREHLFEFELDEYRPLGDPTRFLGALATLFSRCKDEDVSAGGVPRARRDGLAGRRGGAGAATTGRGARARRPRRQLELARAYAPLPGAARRRTGCIDFGDQVALALRLVRTSPAGARPSPARASGTSSSTSSRTRTGPSRSWSRSSPTGTATSRSSATTTSRSTSSAARRSATSSASASATGRRGRSSCAGTTARSRRSSTRRTGSSGTTIRTGSRSRPGSSKRLVAERARPDAAPVRHEAFATAARRRTGSPPRSRGGSPPGRGRATSRSSSGPTATPDPILRRSTWPASRGGSPGTSGLYARPRSGCCWRSCARRRPVVGRRLRASRPSSRYRPRRRGPDAIVTCARRRNRSVWEVLEELRSAAGILRVRPDRAAAVRGSSRTSRYSQLAHERPAGEVLYAFLRDPGWLGRLAAERHRRGRGGSCRTSPASSTSSAASRAARRRPGGLRRAPPPDADRGRRRPADADLDPDADAGRGADRPQGEGPRVPGRVPAGPGRGPLPDPAGASRSRCPRSWSARRCRRATSSSRRSGGCSTWG